LPHKLDKPVLCYVTERRSLTPERGTTPAQALTDVAARVAAAGVDWIQIREKDLGSRALFDLTSEIVNRCATACVLVNDRLDVALAAGAAGVHLGGESVPVAAVTRWVREHAPAGFSVGKSCHSIEEARAAEKDGADYVFFGPIFATPSKLAYGPPQGTGRLRELCEGLGIPVIAIGGISPENAGECIAAGAAGVAAIRWFQEAGDVVARVGALRDACR
jgi:thiamine-phosphate pyrophosphorylase